MFCRVDVAVDGIVEIFSGADAPVLPGLYDALALEHRQLRSELVPQGFVHMRI